MLGPFAWTRFVSAACGAPPLFEMNWSDGYAVADEALTLIAMLSPNAAVVPLFARSGEIAPFQMNRELLVALSVWSNVPELVSISYQRSSAPAPPKTA